MNTQQLIERMRSGSTLVKRWKPRVYASTKPKILYTLTAPDGQKVNVQRSVVESALKRQAIRPIRLQMDGACSYEVAL